MPRLIDLIAEQRTALQEARNRVEVDFQRQVADIDRAVARLARIEAAAQANPAVERTIQRIIKAGILDVVEKGLPPLSNVDDTPEGR